MRRAFAPAFLLFALLAGAPLAQAADEVFATADGAIRGYDPVAYHSEGRAVRGAASITHEWNGATWRFANEANRERFAADPERYAPRYGGYCAYGTSNGYKVSTAPEAFAIVDGVLYLNYSVPVQNTWNQDRPGYIVKADTQWAAIEHEAYASDAATIAAQKLKGKGKD
jgi:YHS domain-containing protein